MILLIISLCRNISGFLNSFSNPHANERSQTPSNRRVEGNLGGLSAIINRADTVVFRKNMNWFSKIGAAQQFETIFSPEVKEKLWPKGAEMLF